VSEITPKEEAADAPQGSDESASADPQSLVLELKQGREGTGKIALTFDAGASSKPTPGLLRVLAGKGVKATFFLTGKWVEQNPDLTRQIIAAGHEIGNHTYSHPDLRKLSDDEIREQLAKTEEIVQAVAGVSTKPYFRPPFGGRDERVLRVAAEEGYRCVYWTADSWDGFKKGIKAAEIEDRVLNKAVDGSIVLMHCGSWPTVDALPQIIDSLRARGYDLVRVSDLAGA
jgi:peptidoglycan/xylan/chitin deacetylase (PgdA/CDA1 family)